MDSFTATARFIVALAPHLTLAEAAALLAFEPELVRQVDECRLLGQRLEAARAGESRSGRRL